jgi:hypothetical protein
MKKIHLIILALITLISCGDETTNIPTKVDDNYYVKINFQGGDGFNSNVNWYFDGITNLSPLKRMFCDYGDIVNIRQVDFWGKINYDHVELGYFRFQELFDHFGCLTKVAYSGDVLIKQFIYDEEKYLKMILIFPKCCMDTIKFYRNGPYLNKIYFSKSHDYITFNYEGKNIIDETYFKADNYLYSINYIYDNNILMKKIYKDRVDMDSVVFEYTNYNLVKANYYNLKVKDYNYGNPSYSKYKYEDEKLINEQDAISIWYRQDNHLYSRNKINTYNYFYENNEISKYSSKYSYSHNLDTYIIYEFKK